MGKPLKGPPKPPPTTGHAEVWEQKQLLQRWQSNPPPEHKTNLPQLQGSDSLDRQLEKHGARSSPPIPYITDEQLRTIATADPSPRDLVDAKHAARDVPAHLAESQVGLAARCTLCGKPVTGRDVPRDRNGRPRHHRCPF